MNTQLCWILIPSLLLCTILFIVSLCYKHKNLFLWISKNIQLYNPFKHNKPEVNVSSNTTIIYKAIFHQAPSDKTPDNKIGLPLKNICHLINQEIVGGMKNLKCNPNYKKLKNGNTHYLLNRYEQINIYSLFDTYFSEPLKLITTICPYLKKEEIYLLILFQTDLRISDIAAHLDVYDPKVLYQRKYRIKTKIRSKDYGIFVYSEIFKDK